jgi:amino-acid N-acetyltransferase
MLASPNPAPQAAPNALPSIDLRAMAADQEPAQIRRGSSTDVDAIHGLIEANLAAGHLLPRTREDVFRHATRFLVASIGGQVAGCAELAPLSRAVAEVRSLVVDERCRGRGVGARLIASLKEWAREDGFAKICAFTHQPSHFVRLGFSIVPHQWLPEKIALDCVGCPKFRQCSQYAMALSLRGTSLRPTPSGQRPYQALPPPSVSNGPWRRQLMLVDSRAMRSAGSPSQPDTGPAHQQ